jgi:hypothetical protein
VALAALVAAAVTLAAPGRARAEGFSGAVEPTFSHVDTSSSGPARATVRESDDILTQRYRLALDRRLTEFLTASVGGNLQDDRGWREMNGVWSDSHAQSSVVYGRLSLGSPVLSGNFGVDRRVQQVLTSGVPAAITESFTSDLSWRPFDLPELQLRLWHVNSYDETRRDHDTTTDNAQFGLRFRRSWIEARYLLGWLRETDHVAGVEGTSVEQSAFASNTSTLLDGRTSTYVSANIQSRETTTVVRSGTGMVTRKQLPIGGVSGTVTLPAIETNVTLTPNPALVDGSLTAGAAVNLGWSLAITGDRDARDVGGQFADVVTDVNKIYVWVDRPIPGNVGTTLAGSLQVYTSDNNRDWLLVNPSSAPRPIPTENRIEVGIPQTHARYVKVSLTPLPLGVTTDTNFRDLLVTEVQFLLVLPAALVPHSTSNLLGSVTASARTVIKKAPDLAHDLSATFTKQTDPSRTTYFLGNGLSANHTIKPGLTANVRGARQDSNDGAGHMGSWIWSVALAGRPVPAATWTLAYSGDARDDGRVDNTLSGFGRAEWYEGVSSQASVGGTFMTQGLRSAQTFQTATSTSLVPNAKVTITGGALYSRTMTSDPDLGSSWSQMARVDGSLSITPAPALSAAATVSRLVIAVRPTTYATLNANYSPFRGDLQFSATYSKSLDTEAQSTTEFFTPAIRWNVRSGVFLTVAYTMVSTSTPAQKTDSRALTGTLLINL